MCKKLSLISRLLLIWLITRGSSSAQMYYEEEPCDFGIYKGICLRASKCLELPAIMKENNLKSADVGHCGFTATEEIICCPKRQVPVPAAKELPNNLADILKPFEFRAPSEDETTASTIQPIPAGFWFSNNFKESNKDESAKNSDNKSGSAQPPKMDDNVRLQSIFSGNQMSNQSPSQDISIDEDTARRINDIFSMKPITQITSIEGNTSTRGINGISMENSNPVRLPNDDDTQRIDTIFNINRIRSGHLPADNTQRISAIFNEELFTIENKLNANNATMGRSRQINSSGISGKPLTSSSTFESIDADTVKRINDIFNTNTAPSGVRIEDNNQVKDDSKAPHGNIKNNNTQEIKFIINSHSLSNGVPIEDNPQNINDISVPVRWPNAFNPQHLRAPAIFSEYPAPNAVAVQGGSQNTDIEFNGNSMSGGHTGDDVTRRINSIFNTNPAQNPIPGEGDAQKINTIFNQNPFQTGNQIGNDPFHNFLKPPRNRKLPEIF